MKRKLRILLIGSQRDEQTDEFRSAARELAVALAPIASQFIVCSTSPSTVDRYALEALRERARKTRVTLIYPSQTADGGALADVEATRARSHPVEVRPHEVRGGWRAAHLQALHDCDVVVALGGSPRGTGTVIYSADVLGKPVVLLPTHGGAAADAWRDFNQLYTDEERLVLRAATTRAGWAPDVAAAVAAIASRNPFRKHRGAGKLCTVVLLAVVGWLLCQRNMARLQPIGTLPANLIAGFAFAATVGVALSERDRTGSTWRQDVLRWLGVATGLAFATLLLEEFASFIVLGHATLFDLSVEEARGLFLRASVLALAAGLTADHYLEGLFDRIRNLLG